ncbi:MAG: hypothetical protein ACK5V3_08575, partial [Bdellovibrionales bacterium]
QILIAICVAIAWAQTSPRQPLCTDSQINHEINVYLAEKAKNSSSVMGPCLIMAVRKNQELDQIRGLRIHPELSTETAHVLRVAEEMDRKKFGLKPGEKIGPEHIKAEMFERGLDPNGEAL